MTNTPSIENYSFKGTSEVEKTACFSEATTVTKHIMKVEVLLDAYDEDFNNKDCLDTSDTPLQISEVPSKVNLYTKLKSFLKYFKATFQCLLRMVLNIYPQ